jgi:hypothetical protein
MTQVGELKEQEVRHVFACEWVVALLPSLQGPDHRLFRRGVGKNILHAYPSWPYRRPR